MADITSSLFPEAQGLLQQQQEKSAQMGMELGMAGADKFALGALGRNTAQGATMLGQGLNKAFGVVSPEEAEINATKDIADRLTQQGVNLQSYDGMAKLAQELSQQGKYNAANKAITAANLLREKETASNLSSAQVNKIVEENKNNASFKAALAQLGPDATSEDIANVAIKFSSPDKAVTVMQGAAEKQAAREQTASLAKEKIASIADQKEADRKSRESIANLAMSLKSANSDLQREMITTRMEDLKSKMQDRQTAQLRQEQGALAGFDTAVASLDTISKHPGKNDVVGKIGGASLLSKIPGTDAAGFVSQLDTFKAQAFLPQVASLKGMGALSDAEGKKLTDAVGALNTNMKQSEFDAQVNKIRASLQAARDRLTSSSTVLPKIASPSTPAAAMSGGAPLTLEQRMAKYKTGAQ